MPNWQEIAVEVERIRANAEHSSENALSSIRREYVRKFHDVSGRNVIAYYSGFLSKRDADGLEINHEDTNAFMVTIHQLDRSRGLDLVLHTPGGGVSAAISIVSYLRAPCMTQRERGRGDWYARRDSNPRPSVPKTDALPLSHGRVLDRA